MNNHYLTYKLLSIHFGLIVHVHVHFKDQSCMFYLLLELFVTKRLFLSCVSDMCPQTA